MTRMLAALRCLEAADLFIAPDAPVPAAEQLHGGNAESAKVADRSLRLIGRDEEPFAPDFSPLSSWEDDPDIHPYTPTADDYDDYETSWTGSSGSSQSTEDAHAVSYEQSLAREDSHVETPRDESDELPQRPLVERVTVKFDRAEALASAAAVEDVGVASPDEPSRRPTIEVPELVERRNTKKEAHAEDRNIAVSEKQLCQQCVAELTELRGEVMHSATQPAEPESAPAEASAPSSAFEWEDLFPKVNVDGSDARIEQDASAGKSKDASQVDEKSKLSPASEPATLPDAQAENSKTPEELQSPVNPAVATDAAKENTHADEPTPAEKIGSHTRAPEQDVSSPSVAREPVAVDREDRVPTSDEEQPTAGLPAKPQAELAGEPSLEDADTKPAIEEADTETAAVSAPVETPTFSPAERAALADLGDPELAKQYGDLGQRLLTELGKTTKCSAALVGAEHQPHVTDVLLRTALSLAKSGKQVLLVDAALADKHLTSGLCLSAELGLAETLKGRVPWQQVVRATATPGLCVLPAGRISPPLLFEGDKRLAALLKELSSQWDLVLLDAGSCHDSAAAAVLESASNVYLLVRLGETQTEAVAAAIEAIENAGARLRGCVATNA